MKSIDLEKIAKLEADLGPRSSREKIPYAKRGDLAAWIMARTGLKFRDIMSLKMPQREAGNFLFAKKNTHIERYFLKTQVFWESGKRGGFFKAVHGELFD